VQRLMELVQKRAKKTFDEKENLIQSGVLDSLDFIRLLAEIEEVFGKEIDLFEADPEKVVTVEGLWELVSAME